AEGGLAQLDEFRGELGWKGVVSARPGRTGVLPRRRERSGKKEQNREPCKGPSPTALPPSLQNQAPPLFGLSCPQSRSVLLVGHGVQRIHRRGWRVLVFVVLKQG